MNTLIVVGCGAATVSLLRFLIPKLRDNQKEIQILIFDKACEPGVGLAYQEDLSNLLINRPAQSMSSHPENLGEFWQWLCLRPEFHDLVSQEPELLSGTQTYITRKLFGHYLKDTLSTVKEMADTHGIQMQFIQKQVVKISTVSPFCVEAEDGEIFYANYVALCTGNSEPKDIYQLRHTSFYLHNPYPLKQNLLKIPSDKRIAIIGNSLTAIDVSISLNQLGHKAAITMFSRKYIHPRIRGEMFNYPLKYLTKEKIEDLKRKKGTLSLRDLLRLFRKELALAGYKSWKFLFVEDSALFTSAQLLAHEINSASLARAWQSLLGATNEVIEICWDSLNPSSKALFMDFYHRIWLNNRSPIPEKNAKILLNLIESGQISMVPKICSIHFDELKRKYIVVYNDQNGKIEEDYDWVINGSGPARLIESEERLLYSLISSGFARENPFGGIDVDFSSNSIIDKMGKVHPHFWALGHITSGTYYYTSSLEMIAKRAKRMADTILSRMHA